MPNTETASAPKKSSNSLGLAILIVFAAVVCYWLWPLFFGLGIGLIGAFVGLLAGLIGLVVGLLAGILGLVVGILSIFLVFVPFILAGALAVFIALAIVKALQSSSN